MSDMVSVPRAELEKVRHALNIVAYACHAPDCRGDDGTYCACGYWQHDDQARSAADFLDRLLSANDVEDAR